MKQLLTLTAATILAACSPRSGAVPPAGADSAAPAGTTTPAPGAAAGEGDSARIARLEREARALARTDGCAGAAQCRMAPVGHRACGGPRTYLPYCASSTDSAALFRKLDELARAEEEYQAKAGMASTCEFREPPVATLAGGRCAAAPGGP